MKRVYALLTSLKYYDVLMRKRISGKSIRVTRRKAKNKSQLSFRVYDLFVVVELANIK
jgi:hypothetical protein